MNYITTIDIFVAIGIFLLLMWINADQKNGGFNVKGYTMSFTAWFMYYFCGYRMPRKLAGVWMTVLVFLMYKLSYKGVLVDIVLFLTCRAVWLTQIIEEMNEEVEKMVK